MSIGNDRQILIDWEAFRNNVKKSTASTNLNESPEEKKRRIEKLEADPQAWMEYHFSNFFAKESPDFHRIANKRLIDSFLRNKHWYEVRHWARGLAKTTTAMMVVLYLVLVKKKLRNIIYTSSTYDAAETFLTKWQAQLDSNQKLINDYGKQELEGSWSKGFFKTRSGVQFMALGAGQSPRGNGNEELRPDCIIPDDFDTDEETRNPDRINNKWDWFEQALLPTVDIANYYLILWLGNKIAPDCCVVRAGKIADYTETINIRDNNGKSTWPSKNSENDIDYLQSKMSYASFQQEYFNNPMRQGQTFKELHYDKCPPLNECSFAVTYSDPGTSNKDKPSQKSKAQNSTKVVVTIAYHPKTAKYYIYKVWCDNTSNSNFIDWLFLAKQFVGDKIPHFIYVENNSLQDPFYEQVLMPLVFDKQKVWNMHLGLIPDTQKKPDKWVRIEATLEPLVRLQLLVFNIDEKENEHMKRLHAQFIAASATSRTLDGPDAVQGAMKIIQDKSAVQTMGNITIIKRKPNKKGY
jgi:hypothetical protein